MTFDRFLYEFHKWNIGADLRLGQHFVNLYIKKPWPELYHERDDAKAQEMIYQYLVDHRYYPNMPYNK
jgi:hypothetical protein